MSFHGPTINVRTTTTTTIPSSSQTGSSNGNRRVTIPSFEEWKKQIRHSEETNDNNKKPKRKSTRGAPNRGQEMIDSVDGGFSDDVGSVFDNGDPNGPVSTAENTYEEGEYIAPQKRQQDQQQSNKKQFAKVPLKSLKERFNYAWTICAATVRDVNKEARGAQSILFESKDQYLLNKCSADKFVIINLCEEILIDTIVLANFEFFSSTFKDFRVYVSNTYPTKDWQLLGQWQARNTRDLQVFKVQDSIGWFEYMKIEFLTHYGNEYYCPLSLVRVHGMPMMEYYNAVESQGLFGNGEIESVSDQHLWPADVREDIIHPQIVTNTSEWFPSKEDMDFDDDVDTEDNGTNDKNITTALSVDGDIHNDGTTITATTATTTTTILPTTDVTDAIPSFSNDTRMLPDNISNSTDQKNGANTIYPSIVSPSTVTATATSINNMDDNRPKNVPNIHNKEPSTQESIYKIIMKRLNALEANATLSQRYMDEQNNMLNDVFTEMEKRHQDQLIYVLDRLNETASNRIDGMVRTILSNLKIDSLNPFFLYI
ncbi:UNC-like C-terminal-domain-containing protein [Halteromyces radiatus]|uniref:UNC-like C-terminal-domain-containing protein n=1 Tax=Halteromyces radiatus TaxID=101107 RepID=UPI00222012B7|nr:UNC-like C-terminal-domain-containing protein [Halteromyces radiatus]KAI8081521.1 UNC-like C-terminal-domain-containing protein [Halteromyces radiatus]